MAFPLSLIRGYASAAKERAALHERQENLKARIAALKGRITMRNASQEDYQMLAELTEEEAQILRQERFVRKEFSSLHWRRVYAIRSFATKFAHLWAMVAVGKHISNIHLKFQVRYGVPSDLDISSPPNDPSNADDFRIRGIVALSPGRCVIAVDKRR